jgi:type I restriction enzyme R subunit
LATAPSGFDRTCDAQWKAGRKKRILYLADRNVLIDQTMVNDFRPFATAMAKLSTNAKTIERADATEVDLPLALDKKRRIDTHTRSILASNSRG